MLNFVQKSILCAKLTTCEKKLFKTSSKSIYSPVNFIGPDSVTDTDLRLNCRIPVSNCKQNLHYARNSDLKLCAMWHLKLNGKAVDVVACQRYVCPGVISITMNVIIQTCIIENCFIEPYVYINYSLSLSFSL